MAVCVGGVLFDPKKVQKSSYFDLFSEKYRRGDLVKGSELLQSTQKKYMHRLEALRAPGTFTIWSYASGPYFGPRFCNPNILSVLIERVDMDSVDRHAPYAH